MSDLARTAAALALAVVLGLGDARAAGEFEAGLKAYDSGDALGAYALWLPLAEAGHVDAQNNIAWLLERGEGVERDLARALVWYRRAAAVDPRWADNVRRVEAALAAAAPAPRAEAGARFDDGLAAYDRGDHAAAYRIWLPLAVAGNADARNNLGWMYEQGEGVERDLGEALRWYREAAAVEPRWNENVARVEAALGSRQPVQVQTPAAAGPGSFEEGLAAYDRRDFRAARTIWRWHAERGHTDAQNNLGWMNEQGEGAAPDLEAALRWYTAAADGNPGWAENRDRVQARLGQTPSPAGDASFDEAMRLFDTGRYAEASRLLEPLAGDGHAQAQTNLGYLYENGLGVARNERAARDWYLIAARGGEAQAQNNLAALLASGRGGAVNLVGAYVWFSVAASTGHAQARANRDALRPMLSRGELGEADRLAGQRIAPARR